MVRRCNWGLVGPPRTRLLPCLEGDLRAQGLLFLEHFLRLGLLQYCSFTLVCLSSAP